MGNPFVILYGTDIAGIPVRLAVTVLKSTIINDTGSLIFSPNLNGCIGTVGEIRKSNFSNTVLFQQSV